MKQGIYRFKYQNRREYAAFYAEAALQLYAPWIRLRRIDGILPVPMYPRKQRIRGYNQAECFGRALSERTGIPMNPNLIRRCRNTKPLKLMNRQERQESLRGAFGLNQKELLLLQRQAGGLYRNVLLVDDIITTGATADAIADLLYEAGVEHVYVLGICLAEA